MFANAIDLLNTVVTRIAGGILAAVVALVSLLIASLAPAI